MPNWKSYESSVRLLSAVLAAHPELRLNYGEVAKFYGDCTASSLDHRFRPIKKEAQKMREEMGAIADKYGNIGTPPKVRANNGVRRAKNAAASGEPANSDDEEVPVTPTKKTPKKEPINRTQAGRVTKARTQQKASQSIYVESDNDDEDIIKTETNGGDYHYGDGIDVEAGPFYDADDADEA